MALSKNIVEQAVTEIAMMPFFPGSDDESRAVLLKHLYQLCSTDDQVRWLAGRFTTLFPKWPGLRELRALACTKFRPKDGIEIYSDAYPDGIPSEKELRPVEDRKQITSPECRALISGLMAPDEQQEYERVQEAIARRNGDLPPLEIAAWEPPAERKARDRREIQEAEREIAAAVAKPTLSAEEKARRIAELEAALGIQ